MQEKVSTVIPSKISKKQLLVNLIVLSVPLTYIIGSLALNLNIALLIIVCSFLFFKDLLKLRFSSIDKIVIIFFSFALFTGFFNTIENYYFNNIGEHGDFIILLKTVGYLRHLALYLILKFLIENNYLKFNLFFISASAFCGFVALDIIYQFFFGFDIFGLESPGSRNSGFRQLSGPFGDELIAGSFIQRFSLFLLFFFPLFFKIEKKFLSISVFLFLFSLILFSLIVTGNRMPFVLFLISIFLIMITEKKLIKYFPLLAFLGGVIFFTLFYNNKTIKINFKDFFKQTTVIAQTINPVNFFDGKEFDRNPGGKKLPDYFDEWETFYDTWRMNKFIGGGVRSFRINCPQRKNIHIEERATCSTHPHNYYLEILTELGVIGLIIFSIIVLKICWNYFLIKISNKDSADSKILIPFFMLFFVEIFPLRGSGSFFNSTNATCIFIFLAITVALINKINNKKT